MRMSTKGRFAVNSMIDLALRERAGPVALATIGARQQISLSYLEQLFARLRQAGLVESTRGPGGGYTLGRRAEDITLADIVGAVDDPAAAAPGDERPAAPGTAMTDHLWAELNDVMMRHMGTITLKSMVDDQLARGVAVDTRPARRAISAQPVVKPVRTSAPNSVFAFGRSFQG
ncbi:MAG: Rrf2 family transcriptional regulator [Rubrivivax sp.]|jgi:Rrf2 family iron-sulfur cluster assembly transcriptional regulator|nr:Rrf2 family transcriptional regulator [Rubrivivax sp.]